MTTAVLPNSYINVKFYAVAGKQTKINLIYLARPEFAQVQPNKVKLFQSFRSFGILLIPSEGKKFTF